MNPKKYPTLSRPPVSLSSSQTPEIKATYLTVRDVAQYLRKSPGAIHNMVYRKQLTAYKPGGRLLFKKEDVDRWVHRFRLIVGYGN